MPLPLPQLPARDAEPNQVNALILETGLSSVIAGQPAAVDPWTFYEVLDRYLGFGGKGYPIEYGKFYCIAFNSSQTLMDDLVTHEWVDRTTIKLQEMLRDFVVDRFKKGTLASLTKDDLSEFAFQSHPAAYDAGGLTKVLLTAPELVPIIMAKPAKEFIPGVGDHVLATLKQVVVTTVRVGPGFVGGFLAALAGPAHTGILTRAAVHSGMDQILAIQDAMRRLEKTRALIDGGKLDNLDILNRTIAQLEGQQYPDLQVENQARSVIWAAKRRKITVMEKYKSLLDKSSGADPEIIRTLRSLTGQ
jgi:hypothetical protein